MVCEISLRIGLVALIFVIFLAACNGAPASPTVFPRTDPVPSPTLTLELHEAPQATTSPPTTGATVTLAAAKPVPLHIATPTKDLIWEALGQVKLDRAITDLRRLSGVEPICLGSKCFTIHNRLTGSSDLQWAKDYVEAELNGLGYTVVRQDWSLDGKADQNLIVRKLGAAHPEGEIYFVAHIDGVKGLLGNDPAADDNASGVVDLLELARVISGYSFNRSIVLLFTTGEEQGTLGVKSYLNQLTPDELSAIKYAVNVDMVGYDANRDHVMELWHGGHSPSIPLVNLMSDAIREYQLNLAPKFVVGCG